MCAGELATAAQAGCRLTVVVFNDSRLTLIEVKQHRRRLPTAGVMCSPTDFSQVAEGFGCKGLRVERARDLVPALSQAMVGEGPVVVDVVVDPTPYREQIAALRG